MVKRAVQKFQLFFHYIKELERIKKNKLTKHTIAKNIKRIVHLQLKQKYTINEITVLGRF